MTSEEECFAAWAPQQSVWSQWTKPVLFAQLSRISDSPPERHDAYDVSSIPPPHQQTAVIVDLPNMESIEAGLALAQRGYRPVPLYNTSPGPSALLDMEAIAQSLRAGAEALNAMTISSAAPPAFLLDSRRMTPSVVPAPGKFDNRWMVFPQDFPSGNYLRTHGIIEVFLLQHHDTPQEDLAHVLLRWQREGIVIRGGGASNGRWRDVTIAPPSRFRRAWYRALALLKLRRNNAGGFGAIIPIPSEGGSGFG